MSVKGLRVMMVLDNMHYGGTETHVLSLARTMKQKVSHIMFVGEGGPLENKFIEQYPTKIVRWGTPGTASYEQSINELVVYMKKERVQIVHLHQTPSGLIAALAAKRLRIPVVLTVHGMYYPVDELKAVTDYSTAVISVSKPVHSYLQRYQIHSHLIPNGVDIHSFSPSNTESKKMRSKFGISDQATVLLYASRLAWGKANVCSNFLKASKQLRITLFPQLEVVIAGGGHNYKELTMLADRIHLETGESFIHMVGNQDNMPAYYRMSDCVVGTGRVALEAMACAKPVLAVGNAGYLGWVTPDQYEEAWKLYFGDHGSIRSANRIVMVEALRKGLANKENMKCIGDRGREWVIKDFNAEKTALSTMKLYEQLTR